MHRARGQRTVLVAALLAGAVAVTASLVTAVTAPEQLLAAHTLEDVLTAVAWAVVAVAVVHGGGPRPLVGLSAAVAACAALATLGDVAGWLSGWVWVPAAAVPVVLVPLCFLPRGHRGRRVLPAPAVVGVAVATLLAAVPAAPGWLWPVATGLVLVTGAAVLAALATAVLRGTSAAGPVVVAVGARVAALLVSALVPGAGPVVQVVTAAAVPAAIGVVLARDLLAEVRTARERLVVAAAHERARLTRDLHDDLGPLLSAIGSCADSALVRLDAGRPDAAEPLHRLRSVTDDAVLALRRVLADLATPGPDGVLLSDAVGALARDLVTARGAEAVVRVEGVDDLPEPWRGTLLRVVAEALHNASRHAAARTVVVHVVRTPDALLLRVTDDGCGFDPSALPPGHGLPSMRGRVAAVGGRFEVTSGPTGTTLSAQVPLPARAMA